MEKTNYEQLVKKPSQELLTSAVESGHIGLVISLMEVLNTPIEEARKMLSEAYIAKARINQTLLLPQVEGITSINPRKTIELEAEIAADKAAAESLLRPLMPTQVEAREAV